MQHLIIDTEKVIRHIASKIQSTCRFLPHKKIKQFKTSNPTNILRKRNLRVIKQILQKLTQNNLIITKTSTGRTAVIIDKDIYNRKFETFLHEKKWYATLPDTTHITRST